MEEIVIRPACPADLGRVWEVAQSAVAFMGSQGNPQWNGNYPARAHFEEALEEGSLYVAEIQGEIAGVVILDGNEAVQYAPLPWTTAQPALVIHKLAVHRDYMGRHVAVRLFRFAGALAKEQGRRGLRVDTYHKNVPMQGLLRSQGFSYVGAVQFPGHQPGDYLCFEKEV